MAIKNADGTNLFGWTSWRPLRFVELFLFIVLILLLGPLLSRSPLLSALLAALLLNTLIVTLSSVGFEVRLRWLLIALWFAGTALNGAAMWTGNISAAQLLAITSDMLGALLTVICVVLILCYVLKSHEVTVDTIFAAFVAYFLIALAFSSIYQAIAVFEPASFSIPAATAGGHGDSLKTQLNYFSFVTIATLGYGDIVPKLPLTQMLAILEAVTGQFYMAVVIAWLVGVYVVREKGG